jgi:hypothetical protein
MDQVIQVVGALLILAAFTASQFDMLEVHSRTYLVLNVVGSAVLAYLAAADSQWGFLLLEAVWTLISLWSLSRVLRGLPVAGSH